MLVREMAARGFVGGFVSYSPEPYYPQSNGQWDEKARAIWSGSSSALAVLCSRAAVDCNLGIAIHGFSQGAGLASLAAQFDSRVSAVLLFAIGTCVLAESSCAQGDGVHTVLQASTQAAYLPINVHEMRSVKTQSADLPSIMRCDFTCNHPQTIPLCSRPVLTAAFAPACFAETASSRRRE